MSIDIRALHIIIDSVSVILGVAMLLTWLIHRQIAALAYWAAADALIAVGAMLALMRGELHPALTVVLANTLGVGGTSLCWLGVRRFRNHPPNRHLLIVPALAIAATTTWFELVSHDIQARIVTSSLLLGIVSLGVTWELWRTGDGIVRRISRFTAALFFIHAGFYAFRAYLFLKGGRLDVLPIDKNPAQAFWLFEWVVIGVAYNLGFLFMAGAQLQTELDRLATHDDLTGVPNRRAVLGLAERDFQRARRAGSGFAILLLDIDHFKAVNDTYGHGAGDEVIKGFAAAVLSQLRPYDIFGRYGGEEFLMALSGSVYDAMAAAERVRATVETTRVRDGSQGVSFTVSIGLAVFEGDQSLSDMISRADAALYRAKHSGRNRVVMLAATESGSSAPGLEQESQAGLL